MISRASNRKLHGGIDVRISRYHYANSQIRALYVQLHHRNTSANDCDHLITSTIVATGVANLTIRKTRLAFQTEYAIIYVADARMYVCSISRLELYDDVDSDDDGNDTGDDAYSM